MMGGPSMGPGPGIMFTIVPIFIAIVFAIVIGSIVLNSVRYFKNAKSPRESVYARVIAKRMEVRNHTSHHSNGEGTHPVSSSRTDYYITLEFDNGERKEYLDVKKLYGLVVEGDEGYAAVQGDWIVAFEREAAQSQ
ncbi:DUF2500 domain-containing protein [Paenibacillus beijingensis]|uniref:DUF2500 domain-containing protein n=1 Tax=Paenibacillus beijingensis TaxID=1126833 RepID=A0A0D5NIS0_9BACL|nr:DUF2500 domain-containing protein [Paenibacillus beijingensis]AJY75151.1 hypothetical protein VN24_11880 [Paenibacillus beijingensis]